MKRLCMVFEDHTVELRDCLNGCVARFLSDAAGAVCERAGKNTAVLTGRTRDSWTSVTEAGDREAAVASAYENALWEEIGTGEYAQLGDGRLGGWRYQDAEGQWHFTLGKPPRRPLRRACEAVEPTLGALAGTIFGRIDS